MTSRHNARSVIRGFKSVSLGLHTMTRPINGFTVMKYEGVGSVFGACALACAAILAMLINTHARGFIFAAVDPYSYNILTHLSGVVFPFAIFIASNWCVSVLMDGEGTLKEIYMSVCYALAPYIIMSLITTVLTHFLLRDDAAIITFLSWLGIIWSGLLVFTGNMTVHQYTVKQTVISLALTLFGVCVIIFLAILCASIVDKIYIFIMGIYNEIRLRV